MCQIPTSLRVYDPHQSPSFDFLNVATDPDFCLDPKKHDIGLVASNEDGRCLTTKGNRRVLIIMAIVLPTFVDSAASKSHQNVLGPLASIQASILPSLAQVQHGAGHGIRPTLLRIRPNQTRGYKKFAI
ncbi:hypothetical protein WG66_014894 [Moniliophthora roreri]|nr:hypothetical protein WG66_014894 [Moniliophthora roreri]